MSAKEGRQVSAECDGGTMNVPHGKASVELA